MNLIPCQNLLKWGQLDVPLFGIPSDTTGRVVEPPVGWCLARDPERLWFIASHGRPAYLHPRARPGRFQAELWRYDVAELFLTDPESGRYLELNLAPNGSWWSAEFTAPRQRALSEDVEFPGVETFGELGADGSWVAALSVPLAELKQRFHFGKETRANVTFIVEAPAQRFLSVAKIEGEVPDFHQPDLFRKLTLVDGDLSGLPGGA